MKCNKCSKDVMILFSYRGDEVCIDCYDEPDSVVEAVIKKFRDRSDAGIRKYGTTLDRNDLSFKDWLTHLEEELMDATLYVNKLKRLVNDKRESYDEWHFRMSEQGYFEQSNND